MRIVGGAFKGQALLAPKGQATRPTSDRVRESLFNVLTHGIEGFSFEGRRVLDLFAGTGALGLEALSRGAAFALFVDNDAEARGVQRSNIEALGCIIQTKLFRRDARQLGKPGSLSPFDLVFVDPPYGKGLAEAALGVAGEEGWLAAGAICSIEERASSDITLPPGFVELDRRRYGDTQVLIACYRPAGQS